MRNTLFHQHGCHPHGIRRGTAVLKDACIMGNSHIQCAGCLFVDLLRIHQAAQYFTCGTCIRQNHIFIGKSMIAHMMIHAESTLCLLKIRQCITQTIQSCTIHTDKQIISPILSIRLLQFFISFYDGKLVIWLFQPDICFDLRIIISQILPETNT